MLIEREDELVARARDRLQEGELFAEPAVVRVFLDLRKALRIPAPTVRQRGRSGDIVDIATEEDRAVIGYRLDRRTVDHRVPRAAPGMSVGGAQHEGGGQSEAAHDGIFQGSSGSRGSTRSDARDGRNTSSVGDTRRTTLPG